MRIPNRKPNKDILSLLLIRKVYTNESTIGDLYINGKFFCYTLEDVVRANNIKIDKETAIPQGIYQVDITYSPRFKRKMPILYGVPMFTGIRIHGGNKAENSEGCILVAYTKINNYHIYKSAEAELTQAIQNSYMDTYITIINQV
jgi:hypothetical protein